MMVAETTTDWLTTFRRTPRKGPTLGPKRCKIGILTFEVVNMMSEVVNLWQLVSDAQIDRLRVDIGNSLGIHKLVSEDDEYLMDIALAEIIDNLECVAKSVVRLGKRCTDPVYQNLDQIFSSSFEMDLSWSVWQYRLKKMDRKVKKMERFVVATKQLYHELEVLGEYEQTLRRLTSGSNPSSNPSKMKLLEFQQKVMLQRHEVKNLQEISPWVRTYDYIVRLLLRSICTIIMRIKYAFGINQLAKTTFFNFKRKLLVAPPSTLGFAALALHYANIIILIEKLASSPQLISLDARDDLYNMLPASVKTTTREMLRPFSKKLASSIYDLALAEDWSLALARILEWLSPLAQNTVRWHSKRNVEKHQMTSGTNVLLVQTLYFASKAKTESTIRELLFGLTYLSQYDQRS